MSVYRENQYEEPEPLISRIRKRTEKAEHVLMDHLQERLDRDFAIVVRMIEKYADMGWTEIPNPKYASEHLTPEFEDFLKAFENSLVREKLREEKFDVYTPDNGCIWLIAWG